MERLDRQLRIEGWNQDAITDSRIAVIGDNDHLASHYILSAAALGFKEIDVIAPDLCDYIINTAKAVNPELKINWIKGHYTHPTLSFLLKGSNCIVDLTDYNLANKMLLNLAQSKEIPLVRAMVDDGFKVFTYLNGREWKDLESVISKSTLPTDGMMERIYTRTDNGHLLYEGKKYYAKDPILSIIATGIALEETKNALMGKKVSEDVIAYDRSTDEISKDKKILVVGAGALGNFVSLALGYMGYKGITIMDPDIAELHNLNRQVLLYDGVDRNKAVTLCKRLDHFFHTEAEPRTEYFRRDADISRYDVVFDCTDNFETRIVLSEKCKEAGRMLVSGGTNVDAGQALLYDPNLDSTTIAQRLGLYDIVKDRELQEYVIQNESCTYRPDPSVIMTNQIIAGFMVDLFRKKQEGKVSESIFYDSNSDAKFGG